MSIDDSTALTLFGHSPNVEECEYLRKSLLRFKGESTWSMAYLKTVNDIVNKGEALGSPTRQMVIDALDAHGQDARKATTFLREEHHRRRDAQLKAEYQKLKAASR